MRTLLSILAVLALAFGLSVPASAEQPTAWPRGESLNGHSNGASVFRTSKQRVAPAPTYNPWTDAFIPYGNSKANTASDAGGQIVPTPQELDAQVASYRLYWARRNAELYRDGELADVLPVRVHERLNAKAFGSPVMSGDN